MCCLNFSGEKVFLHPVDRICYGSSMNKFHYLLLLFLSSVSLFCFAETQNTFVEFQDTPPIVKVQGLASLMVPPDRVTLSFGVVTEADTAEDALSKNSQRLELIIETLQSMGFDSSDYQTQHVNVRPRWSPRPRTVTDDWASKIVGYQVSNTLTLQSKVLKSIGEVIARVTQAGANRVDNIRFDLENSRQYRNQTIQKAITNAREDAEIAAIATGLSLGNVREMQIDPQGSLERFQSLPEMLSQSDVRSAKVMAPPVEPGLISVSAHVNIVYELFSANPLASH